VSNEVVCFASLRPSSLYIVNLECRSVELEKEFGISLNAYRECPLDYVMW
jgi:hypothetical protein